MDNQHRQIKGYRELTAADIALMNEVKAMGPQLQALFEKVGTHIAQQRTQATETDNAQETERLQQAEPEKWLNWARDTSQTAVMYATRAIAQPTFF